MPGTRIKGSLRYLLIMSGICLSLFLLVELTGWLLVPDRYNNPPAVTIDAWIHSDALTGTDTLWLKEFVDEFCRSYSARWTSYIYFRREPFTGRLINVDSSGRRITPQFQQVPDDKRHTPTVMLLGGSTMWGTCSRDSATIPAALARLIAANPAKPSLRVMNMGESGYVNTQSLISLELELRKGNVPESVLLYDGINDVFSAYQNDEGGLPQNEQNRVIEFNLLQDGERMLELGIRDFWKKTVTAGLVETLRDLNFSAPPPPPLRGHLAEDVVRLYRGNLEILDALSRHYGFRYYAYWQPVVFSKLDPSQYEKTQIDKMKYVHPFFLDVYRRVAADSTLRANPHFHNLSGIFDGAGPVYLDFCHISERGNGIVAQRFYEDLFR
jgi:hypothetical protein